METVEPIQEAAPVKKNNPVGRIVLGILFLLPALFLCVSERLLPTISTLVMSLQKVSFLRPEREFIGLDNYTRVFGDGTFVGTLGSSLVSMIVRLLVIALIPLALAWATSRFGRPLRLGLRTVFSLPVAFFVPVAIAIAWVMALNPVSGLFNGATLLGEPGSARAVLLSIDALYLFGLASGLGLIVFLPIWRRPAGTPAPTFRETLKPVLTVWGIGILASIAWTTNTFTLNFVMTAGGPVNSTQTLATWMYQFAFRTMNLGPAAVIASLILLWAFVPGIISGLTILLTRLRLNTVEARSIPDVADLRPAPKRNVLLPGIVLALLLLLLMGACLLGVLPFGWLIPQSFDGQAIGKLLEQIAPFRLFSNTFAPPVVSALLQIAIAYLAALSLGALRPLGRHSEWILLLFSPWLFVTLLPLSLVNYLAVQKSGLLGTFAGSLPPFLLSIPVLYILTLFFKGRAAQWQHAGAEEEPAEEKSFFKHFVLPSLPLAGVLLLLHVMAGWQALFWPMLVNAQADTFPLSVALMQIRAMYLPTDGMLAPAVILLVTPVCIFFFLCLAIAQIFYLDRLVLYTEEPSKSK
jgi:ABC-type sugar transport system permease subunit